MKRVISLGEIMLRLSPANDLRFLQTECLDAVFGGSEANVAVALSQLGQPAAFVTKLPDNVVGEMAVQVLRRYGVDTSTVIRGGKRLGIYFLEKGFSSCSSICTYDRAHSAIAEAKPEEFDWKRIFEEAGWFHFSGITPALSDEAAEICLQACRTARELGIGVSCDVNYRSKLWSMDKAREVMSEIGRYVDVAIVNEEEAAVLGADIRVDEAMNAEVYAQMAEQLNKKFDFGKIASVARVPSENGLAVQGILWDRSGICCSRRYPLESIVDPRLLETIGKEADVEDAGTDTGSQTEKTVAGETEQAPAVEETALLPTSEESAETIAEAKPKRKYTRRKGVEKKTEKKSVHPKGYSVNGRKLGRPRKVSSVNEMEAYAPNAVLLKDGNAAAKIESKDAVTEEAKAEVVGTTAFEAPFPTEMPLEKEDGAAVSETVPESYVETEVQEEPAFKSKKERRLESRRQMMLPTQAEAAACAKKLERIGDKPWMLLTPQQKESCKAVKIELNEVIKKVGGDLFEGHYLTNPPSYGNKPAQKIRFAAEL